MKTFFITGATGLVGSALVEYLSKQENTNVVAYVRNKSKADLMFDRLPNLTVVEGGMLSDIQYSGDVDYIVHSAAPTGSDFFINNPVETIDYIVNGTRAVLEFAKSKNVESVVNISSMEVYGASTSDEPIPEDKQFYIDPLNIRSNYPLSKRLCENMCVAYSKEYDVPVKSVRLAQVLAKKLQDDDNRVVAQFIRSAKDGKNIEIATDGSSKQTYISIDDAVSGILTVLHKGEKGASYNLANNETYCSIYDLAKIIVDEVAGDRSVEVITNTSPDTAKYPPNRFLNLDISKLKSLGWSPRVSLVNAVALLAREG